MHLFILFIPHDDENTYHLFVCRCPVQRALPHLPRLYGQGACLSLLPTEDGYGSLPLPACAHSPRPRATLPATCPRLSSAGALPATLCRAGTTRAFRHSGGVLRDPSQGLEDAYSMGGGTGQTKYLTIFAPQLRGRVRRYSHAVGHKSPHPSKDWLGSSAG